MNLPAIFYPPPELHIPDLEQALQRILADLKLLIPEQQIVKKIVVTIEEKVQELLQRLQQQTHQSFQNITGGRSKIEIIILFLAMLHLLRDRIVTTEQNEQFSDIIIRHSNHETN